MFELRFAVRGLRRDWAFTLAGVAILALAIGLNVTVFSVMRTMLHRGHPHAPQSGQLAWVDVRKPLSRFSEPIPYTDFEAWQSQTETFEHLAFIGGDSSVAFRDHNAATFDTRASRVSASTFAVMGVLPRLGRALQVADERPGAAPVVVLSHRFWSSRLGARPDVIGSIVHVDGTPRTVVGVMPEGFVIVYERYLFLPLALTPALAGGVFGRLRDDSSVDTARAELAAVQRRLAAARPADERDVGLSLKSYAQAHTSPDAPRLYGSLWAGAWLVWLIGCANLSNLMLVRTIGRWRELTTRTALGAGRAHLIRQALVESFLLASLAAACGWALASWSVRTWAETTASRYLAFDYTFDLETVTYLVAISVGAAFLCSVAPILKITRIFRADSIDVDARGVTQGTRSTRLAGVLTAGQMALAMVLLSGAGVLVRSLVTIVGAETGVRSPERIVVGAVILPSETYPHDAPATRLAFFDRLEARLQAMPGVELTTFASSLPVDAGNTRPFEIDGRPSSALGDQRVQFLAVGSSYFQVVGASAVAGRHFNDGDDLASPPVALVNQSFADTVWPGQASVGQRLRVVDPTRTSPWRTVVGVVPNIMQGDPLRQRFMPLIYVPLRQDPSAPGRKSGGTGLRGANVLLRTTVSPDALEAAIRAELQKEDPSIGLEDFGTLRDSFVFDRDRMDLEHADLGKYAAVAPILAGVALLLATAGLFAVVAHSVTQRTKEIGVRMAIGAAARDISRMVLGEGLIPVAIGLSVGVAASFAVNRVLESQLVGVSPHDPLTMMSAPVVLTLVALLACWLPVRRAMHVDPVVALRHE